MFFIRLSHLPMPSRKWRPLFCKWGGVNVLDYKHTFIGENVVFDSNHPEDIIIHTDARITNGCKIITHFKKIDLKYVRGQVIIKEGAFLGMNTLVVKPVTIGKKAVIGAGSVVTKDIPDGEIWAGNPARYIKKIKCD